MKCSPVETFLQHFKQKHDLSMFRNKFQPGSVRTVEHPSWWEFVQWLKSNKLHPERWWLCNDMWRSHKCGNPKKHCCFYNASMLLVKCSCCHPPSCDQTRPCSKSCGQTRPCTRPDQTLFKKVVARLDEHWRPFSLHCAVCSLPYNYVLKVFHHNVLKSYYHDYNVNEDEV